MVEKGLGTVLVVDDEECLRHIAGIALSNFGYTVLTADSVESAVNLLEGHDGQIDLLLSDVRLSDSCGVQLASAFRACHPRSEVVFMTAYSPEEIEVWLSGETVLPKPFDLDTLCAVVGRSMRNVA